MTIEEQLKALILSKYRSVNAFAKLAGVPSSTLDSMLKGSVMNASVDNVIKICKFLGISADGLGDRKIVSQEQLDLTPAEVELIKMYRQLDERGQRRVMRQLRGEYEDAMAGFGEESQSATGDG